jgi:hypothetical protein
VFEAYMSPGSVTEKLFFYVAEYRHDHRADAGGGDQSEGEDIEVIELPFEEALEIVKVGKITDGKTIMLLPYVQTAGLLSLPERSPGLSIRSCGLPDNGADELSETDCWM